MVKAFGETLCRSTVPSDDEDEWVKRWRHLKGKLYHVHGGPVGRKYVDQLSIKVSHLAVGNFSSERLMVFSGTVLQRNRMVRKGSDIRRVVER
jgi:hypothetical protein